MKVISKPLGKRLCLGCGQPIKILVPTDRAGNVWGEDWQPCQNPKCKKCGKAVRKVLLS